MAGGVWERGVAVRGVLGQWAAFSGLVTCGSVWSCPSCAAKIARVRAVEVRRAIAGCRAAGGEVYMLTLTTPHDQGDRLKPMMAAVAVAWRYVCQGRAWMALKRELGCIGFIRGADDPTVGSAGWHPHLHTLVFFGRPLTCDEQARLREYVYGQWAAAIVRRGYRRPSWERGVVLTVSQDDVYITKLGLADELVGGMYKQAREGRRTPLQLLLDAERGDGRALELFREFATAMEGRRRITWSRGLRGRYLAEPERSDATIADEEQPAAFEVPVTTRLWSEVLVDSDDLQSAVLDTAVLFGAAGARSCLELMHEAVVGEWEALPGAGDAWEPVLAEAA